MKNRKAINVFQFLKTPEAIFKKEKQEKGRESYQTNDESDEETTSSNKSLTESEKNFCGRGSSTDYFKNKSSISSNSNLTDNEKDLIQKKFIYTSKNIFGPDDFELLSLLGSGAYAKVYKARLKKNGDFYAIKMIDKVIMEKEEKLYQIYIENEFLNLLNHPNIIKTYGVYEDEEKICIVLEYVPKGTLTSFIEKTNTAIDRNILVYYVAQLVSIVEYLGTKNIVHRDIKPDNLLIDSNYNLKLIDFATAFYPDKFFDEETCSYLNEDEFSMLPEEKKFFILKSQICQGTPNFMSPEVINNNYKCGIYSDLWSVACVLYTMVYSFPPFYDKTEYLVFQNILNLNYRFPSNRTVSNDIKDLIKSLLKLNPIERLGSNGNLEALKNHSFFNYFNANSIDDDLKNAYISMKNRRYSIDFKNINKETNELKSPAKKYLKQTKFKKADKKIGEEKIISKEKGIRGFNTDEPIVTTSIINKLEDEDEDFDNRDYFDDLKQFEIEDITDQDEFLPIENIQEKKNVNFSDKEFTLKFELSNQFQLGNNQNEYKDLQKKIEKKNNLKEISPNKNLKPTCTNSAYNMKSGSSGKDIFKTPMSPIITNTAEKINLIPYSKMKPKKQEKTNLEILLSNNQSLNKVLKMGNLKMLSPWNFYDNRKMIFYKNLNFEYYDIEKNELKGTINLNSDFTAIRKDTFQFDLVSKGKIFSFISRKEEEIKDWIDIINKTINESKRNWLRKST